MLIAKFSIAKNEYLISSQKLGQVWLFGLASSIELQICNVAGKLTLVMINSVNQNLTKGNVYQYPVAIP